MLHEKHIEQIFYYPYLAENEKFTLDEDEWAHLRVLRIREGEEIFFTDGKGGLAAVRGENLSGKKPAFKRMSFQKFEKKQPFSIHIALSPTKNADRMEFFVEKATEIGIDEISFVFTEHSEKKALNHDRMLKKALSAMKQSKQFFLPQIHQPIKLQNFFEKMTAEQKFIAHIAPENTENLFKRAKPLGKYCVLIGAEGGFTENEVQIALQNDFSPVHLGNHRLRTETAALKSCIILNLLNE